ncbi:Cytochrome c oxidase subunit 6 [Quaeritorhiza haematococci]|nr:Cytochrome c oxidase subunit 6 [Quaeritorhiza haematococci]
MNRFLLTRLSRPAGVLAFSARRAPVMRAAVAFPSVRSYATDLDPANKKDYDAYVQKWSQHFQTLDDDFELERGLNHIFAADWVPSVEVLTEAFRAARRLNTFATSVRILEALENKVESKKQYTEYLKELKPLLEELGVPERKELGEYQFVREKKWWY